MSANSYFFIRPFFVYAEDDTLGDISRYYYTGADAPLSSSMVGMTKECDAVCVHDIIDAWITHVPSDNDVLWMVSAQYVNVFSNISKCKYY